jgi:hypothetical protein
MDLGECSASVSSVKISDFDIKIVEVMGRSI